MSAEKTETSDHFIEAQDALTDAWGLIEKADDAGLEGEVDRALKVNLCTAIVSSNLAIAEGQERVAAELAHLRKDLSGLVTGGTDRRVKVADVLR